MINAVLFDMDGVLVQSFDCWLAVMNDAAARLKCPSIGRDALERTWGQSVDDDAQTFFAGHSPSLIADLYGELLDKHAATIRFPSNSEGSLAALQERKLQLAVVTNTPRASAVTILKGTPFRGLPLFTPGAGRRPKPSADLLFHACATLRVPPSESVFVGDSECDERAASAAKIRFVGVAWPGDPTIESLSELAVLLERC